MGKKDRKESESASADENIKVIVRCRPLSSKEIDAGYKSCVDLDLSDNTVTVHTLCGNPDRWTFDAVINNTYTQRDVFTQYIRPMVDSVLEGFNATVFAYGQSGSGKTHTMTGKMGDEDLQGIIPRTFAYIFGQLRQFQATNANKRFSLYVSFIELYNGKVRDLLAKQQVPLAVKENKDKTFYVQGSHIPQVKTQEDILSLMEEGTERRQVAATELNADSSRSHSIFTLVIECTETTDDGDVRSVTSKLNLVDLAGSERQSKTGATGDTLKEGCNINLSLSALGTVIDTLVKGKGHVPFRSSPLTMLLKDSLGGSSKTAMFANIGPSEHNISETISTLRFADRAKQIKNKPVVNMDTKDQKIAELTEMVAELKEKLKQFESGGFKQLEEENEGLKEKVGELEVELDNAVKGREADAVDIENRKSQWEIERQELKHRAEESEREVQRLQGDLLMAESVAQDERNQREEVMRLCSEFLSSSSSSSSSGEDGGATEKREIHNVDELAKVLRDRSHGANSVELAKAQSSYHTLEVEQRALIKEHETQMLELRQLLESTQGELTAVQKKFKKAKELLYEEREARKQLAGFQRESSAMMAAAAASSPSKTQQQTNALSSPPTTGAGAADASSPTTQMLTHTTSTSIVAAIAAEEGQTWRQQRHELEERHAQDIEAFQEKISRLYEELENNVKVRELEEELLNQREQFEARIAQLKEEADTARNALVAPSESDSDAVTHLKRLVSTQQHAAQQYRSQVDALESLVEHLKAQRYEAEKRTTIGRGRTTGISPTHGGGHNGKKKRHRHGQEGEDSTSLLASTTPTAVVAGTAANQQEGGHSPQDAAMSLEALEVQLHKDQRDALRIVLDTTASQRNELLETLVTSQSSNDTAAHMAQLTKENELLRQQFLNSSKQLDERQTTQFLEAVEKMRGDFRDEATMENSVQEAASLKHALMQLQGQLEKQRFDANEKERVLMATIEKMSRGGRHHGGGGGGGKSQRPKTTSSSSALLQENEKEPSTPLGDATGGAVQHAAHLSMELLGDDATAGASSTSTGGGGDDVEESPMRSLVDLLQREKAQLLADLANMERELLLRTVERSRPQTATGGDGGGNNQNEVDTATTSTAMIDVGSSAADLAAVLQRKGSIVQFVDDEQRRALAEQELRSKTSVLEVERSQMQHDLDALKSELEEERQRRNQSDHDKQELMDAVKRVKAELADSDKHCVTMENKLHEQQAETARVLRDVEQHTTQVDELERRLSERSNQLTDLRNMLAQQKQLMSKTQERADEAMMQVKELQRAMGDKDRLHAINLQEREEAVLKATNRRIEALAEEHQRDLTKKDEDAQRLRKKLRKMEAQLQKAKERYDEKVCEYEELSNILEEQKVEAMRLMLKQSGQTTQQVLDVQDQQEQIQSTLQRAKEEQRKKKDKFSMGESTSALSQVRAAGNAINLVKKMGQVMAQPPTAGSGSGSGKALYSERSSEDDM